jgi:hypothetical protein
MLPTEQFLRHAVECEEMARFTRDLESKATWRRMAERWRRCAEVSARESSVGSPQLKLFRVGRSLSTAGPRTNEIQATHAHCRRSLGTCVGPVLRTTFQCDAEIGHRSTLV